MKESKNFLAIYGIVIIVLLVLILFILPDDFFSRKYEQNIDAFNAAREQDQQKREEIEAEKKKEFVDYKEQQNQILNGEYDYEYLLIDYNGTETLTYECTGKKARTVDSGSCTSPSIFSYTEKDKLEKFKKYMDPTYIEPKNIFNLVNKLEYSLESHQLYREYTYNTKINKLDTKIVIQTKKDYITKITILNPYMQYIINYSNVKVDN